MLTQGKDSNSLTSQEKICKNYALKNGYEVEKVYFEVGNGVNKTRPTLQKLVEALRNSCGATLLITEDNRISRNIIQYLEFRKKLLMMGSNLIEVSNTEPSLPINTVDMINDFCAGIYKEMRSKNIKKGIRFAKLNKKIRSKNG